MVRRALHDGGDELAAKLMRNLAAAGGGAVAIKLAPHVPALVSMLAVGVRGELLRLALAAAPCHSYRRSCTSSAHTGARTHSLHSPGRILP